MTVEKAIKTGGLLLAAGGSSRLGRSKQLVVFEGETLIRRAAKTLTNSVCSPVVVVLGAETDFSSRELDGLGVSICINDDWNSGISSSIKAGLKHLLNISPDPDAVIITLCDQPLVTARDIDRLAETFASTRHTVASSYGDAIGVPALFGSELFGELLALDGDEGARKLIRSHPENVSTVELNRASVDIDTTEDLLSRLVD
ncbi:nucleotidyltransferase family protein [soil metagenome]